MEGTLDLDSEDLKGDTFNPNNATKPDPIFVKLS